MMMRGEASHEQATKAKTLCQLFLSFWGVKIKIFTTRNSYSSLLAKITRKSSERNLSHSECGLSSSRSFLSNAKRVANALGEKAACSKPEKVSEGASTKFTCDVVENAVGVEARHVADRDAEWTPWGSWEPKALDRLVAVTAVLLKVTGVGVSHRKAGGCHHQQGQNRSSFHHRAFDFVLSGCGRGLCLFTEFARG